MPQKFNLQLTVPPRWDQYIEKNKTFENTDLFMDLLIEFMHHEKKYCQTHNIDYGPFAALVAQPKTVILSNDRVVELDESYFLTHEKTEIKKVIAWQPISIACNQVVSMGQAVLHGEVLASMIASQRFKEKGYAQPYDFFSNKCLLVTTSAPCEMCLNVIKWLKPNHVIAGSTRLDTFEHTCFNEGLGQAQLEQLKLTRKQPEQEAWVKECQDWGIDVKAGIQRERVIEKILSAYEGIIYQPEEA